MFFNSLDFLIFISLFLPLYFFSKGRQQILIALLGSYLFYAWWDWRFLSLIVFSTIVDFHLGKHIFSSVQKKQRKYLLGLSIGLNLGLLAFFKYYNFFIDSFATGLTTLGLNAHLPTLQIILPVGISFYTFQTMSYSIDIYRRQLSPERDFLKFATFVAFFPQLVAGPIIRAKTLLPQFQTVKRLEWSRFISGFTQVTVGFFKKVAVADSLALVIDQVFDSPAEYSSLMLMVVGVLYSVQIYCDFSGYSDIAIGIARIMGFDFPENFKQPYFSKSFSEFWRRWHISLSSWLRDYLYISLGGNRGGKIFTYRNLMLTMLLGGLWHGANWTFIVWGALHGLFLVLQRGIQPIVAPLNTASNPFVRHTWHMLCILTVFCLTSLAWFYFRLPSITEANAVVMKILSFDNMSFSSLSFLFNLVKSGILIGILLLIDLIYTRIDLNEYLVSRPVLAMSALATLIWLISFLGTFDNQAFIYFQF